MQGCCMGALSLGFACPLPPCTAPAVMFLPGSFWLSFICLPTSFCRAHPEEGCHTSYCSLETRGVGDFPIYIQSLSLWKHLSHLSLKCHWMSTSTTVILGPLSLSALNYSDILVRKKGDCSWALPSLWCKSLEAKLLLVSILISFV